MADTNLAHSEVVYDDDAPLYAARKAIFPRSVKGTFRTLKWWLMVVTLGIYYLTPWIRWDRGADMPDQAVLVDLANRRFFFFWIEIWPQEFYYIIGLLVMAGVGLFLFTSTLGRVWCGYACPQTVWVDLYLHVERWIDGDRNAQLRLNKQPWGVEKTRKRLTKWTIWLLIAIATGGAWIFYFADAPTLAMAFLTGEAHYIAYATVATLTATTFILGGFMREQVCIYMCPWPRIQGAMLDKESLVITYKDWRGEPRGKHRKSAEAKNFGDCVDCNACVAVCPMGIDIRDGQQLECITCALCIDACDDVMKKIGKPRGLIDYVPLSDCERQASGKPAKPIWGHIFRPRTILYASIWAAIGIAMVVMLFIRDTIDVTVQRDRNPIYVTMSDGTIRNGFTLKILNKNPEAKTFKLSIKGEPGLAVRAQDVDHQAIAVGADQVRELRVFVDSFPFWTRHHDLERYPFRFWVEDISTRERTSYESVFVVPSATP